MNRVCYVLMALAITPALAGPPVPARQRDPIKKLLVIGVDGLRADALEAADAPYVHALIAGGCYSNDGQSEDLTFSGPNWATILHGVHRDKHNVTSNDYGGGRLALYPDFLEYLEWHDRSLVTVRITTWDQIYLKQPTGADIDIFQNHSGNGDAKGAADAARLLTGSHPEYAVDVDAMFVYFADVDEAGHSHGFSATSAGYLAAIARTDARIGQIVDAIESRPTYPLEDWLFILTSDHGGAPDGSHHGNTPEKRRIPFIVSGPSAARGAPFPQPKAVDVTKTALAFMGAPIPADLDGNVVGLQATARPRPRLGVNLIFNGDAEYDRGFSDSQPDQYLSGWDDPGPDQVTSVVYGAPGYPGVGPSEPPDRGQAFFMGGQAPVSTLTQNIDIAGMAARVDTGTLRFTLSGWLGGYGAQHDAASVHMGFKDSAGAMLGQAVIGPVGPGERAHKTGMVPRSAQGLVPVGTRRAEITLTCTRTSGASNDGYADNLSLVLTDSAAPPH